MEEILASIRRIVADDPSGASPLIDLNQKPVDRTVVSGSGDVGADDSPDFELPSMFRPESGTDQLGKLSAKLNAKPKSAPIGRLTDAIRNVAPKAVPGNTQPRAQPQNSAKPVSQGDKNVQRRDTQPAQGIARNSGDAGFGIRPKSAQSLSSLANPSGYSARAMNGSGAALHNGNGVHHGATQSTNDHGEGHMNANGSTANFNDNHQGGTHPECSQQAEQNSTMADGAGVNGQNQGVQPNQATTNTESKAPQPSLTQAAAKPAANPPPRVMAAFRDTRMQMMGPSAQATPKQGEVPQATPEPVSDDQQTETTQTVQPNPNAVPGSDIGAIVPGSLDLPGRGLDLAAGNIDDNVAANESHVSPEQNLPDQATEVAPAPHQVAAAPGHAAASPDGLGAETNPPPLPDGSEASAVGPIEDATADLLRPMLRQWLSDNMPRMVEKALHIEVAETVRTGKPTEGS